MEKNFFFSFSLLCTSPPNMMPFLLNKTSTVCFAPKEVLADKKHLFCAKRYLINFYNLVHTKRNNLSPVSEKLRSLGQNLGNKNFLKVCSVKKPLKNTAIFILYATFTRLSFSNVTYRSLSLSWLFCRAKRERLSKYTTRGEARLWKASPSPSQEKPGATARESPRAFTT